MKRCSVSFIIMLCMVMVLPIVAYANMAAPQKTDVGTAVTFEQNEEIAVLSEVLDIVVHGAQAEITATYTMKNMTDSAVSTESMFLSPNIEQGGTEIIVNGASVAFAAEQYALYYDTKITTDDWQYVVLTNEEIASPEERTVDVVTFEMQFAPQEQYDVVVSYTYTLGGYPDYDFNAKCGEIYYYLAPAAMWSDFENLTINLTLDEDMPVITYSSVDFEKTGTRTYQYVSNTLPSENLEIAIDENWIQNISSTLRSPYLKFSLIIFSPFILLAVVAIGFIVWFIRKRKHRRN